MLQEDVKEVREATSASFSETTRSSRPTERVKITSPCDAERFQMMLVASAPQTSGLVLAPHQFSSTSVQSSMVPVAFSCPTSQSLSSQNTPTPPQAKNTNSVGFVNEQNGNGRDYHHGSLESNDNTSAHHSNNNSNINNNNTDMCDGSLCSTPGAVNVSLTEVVSDCHERLSVNRNGSIFGSQRSNRGEFAEPLTPQNFQEQTQGQILPTKVTLSAHASIPSTNLSQSLSPCVVLGTATLAGPSETTGSNSCVNKDLIGRDQYDSSGGQSTKVIPPGPYQIGSVIASGQTGHNARPIFQSSENGIGTSNLACVNNGRTAIEVARTEAANKANLFELAVLADEAGNPLQIVSLVPGQPSTHWRQSVRNANSHSGLTQGSNKTNSSQIQSDYSQLNKLTSDELKSNDQSLQQATGFGNSLQENNISRVQNLDPSYIGGSLQFSEKTFNYNTEGRDSPVNYIVISEDSAMCNVDGEEDEEDEEDMITEDDVRNNNNLPSTSVVQSLQTDTSYAASKSSSNNNSNINIFGGSSSYSTTGTTNESLIGTVSDASEKRDFVPVHTALDLATGQLCVISIPKQSLPSQDQLQLQRHEQPQLQQQQQEQQQHEEQPHQQYQIKHHIQQHSHQPQSQNQQYHISLDNSLLMAAIPNICNSNTKSFPTSDVQNDAKISLNKTHTVDEPSTQKPSFITRSLSLENSAKELIATQIPSTSQSRERAVQNIETPTTVCYVHVGNDGSFPNSRTPLKLNLESLSNIEQQQGSITCSQDVNRIDLQGNATLFSKPWPREDPQKDRNLENLASSYLLQPNVSVSQSNARATLESLMSTSVKTFSAKGSYQGDAGLSMISHADQSSPRLTRPSEATSKSIPEGGHPRTWRFHNVNCDMQTEKRRERGMEVDIPHTAPSGSKLDSAQQTLSSNTFGLYRAFSSTSTSSLSSSKQPLSTSSTSQQPPCLSEQRIHRTLSESSKFSKPQSNVTKVRNRPLSSQLYNSTDAKSSLQHFPHPRALEIDKGSSIASLTLTSFASMLSSKQTSCQTGSPPVQLTSKSSLLSPSSSFLLSSPLPAAKPSSSHMMSSVSSSPSTTTSPPTSSPSSLSPISSSTKSHFKPLPSSTSSSLHVKNQTTASVTSRPFQSSLTPNTLNSLPSYSSSTRTDDSTQTSSSITSNIQAGYSNITQTFSLRTRSSSQESYASNATEISMTLSPSKESDIGSLSPASLLGAASLPPSPLTTTTTTAAAAVKTGVHKSEITSSASTSGVAQLQASTSGSPLEIPEDGPSSSLGGQTDVESGRRLRIRCQRRFLPEKARHKRQALQDMTRPLKLWLYRHRENPYPSKSEKMELVKTSHMSLTQVSNWFANARRRLKNTVQGEGISWSRRIQAYNDFAEGNAELFSIPSSEEDGEEEEGDFRPDIDATRRTHETNRRRSSDTEDTASPGLILDLPSDKFSPLREGEAPAVKRKRQDRDITGVDIDLLEGLSSNPTGGDFKRRGQVQEKRDKDREREITTPSPAPTLTSSFSDAGCSVTSPGSAPSSTPGPPPLFSVPSRVLTPPVGTSSGAGGVPGGGATGSGGGACHKYKHSMMQRYLQDASQQAAISNDLDLSSSRLRHRHLSSSTGSHDFEYLSTSSVSSPSHEPQEPQADSFDDFSEEFESIAIRRRLSDNTASTNDEMYWKEIGAALALTTLARSNVKK